VRDGKVVDHRDYWDLASSLAASLPLARSLYRLILERLG
jgi:hypothetical protein